MAGINELEAEQAVQQAIPAAVESLAPEPPEPGSEAAKPAPEATQSPNAAQPPDTATNPNPPPLAGSTQPAGSVSHSKQRSKRAGTAAAAKVVVSPPATPVTRQPPIPIVVHTYTRDQLASGQLPPSEWGKLLAHSYSPNGGWYVMVIPAAFQMQALPTGTTHFSPWSYDRHVPLSFYGAPFTPGTYHGRVQPVDLAATLASLLGVNQPSASVGNVLTQAIHTLPPLPVPRVGKGARHPQEGPPNP